MLPDPAAWRFCLAPMMQKTDRHFRYLVRLLAPAMRLYTEMITTGAILHGDRDRFLRYDPSEQPLALQLGGADPDALARAAALAAARGYAEVNLNCGCPSDRVRAGAFGACLMRDPALVASCVTALLAALPATVTVSVKTRLGVDDCYSYGYFRDFVGRLHEAGCQVFHIHARKAWLQGLSPRENREIPPLEYDWVYRLKRELPAAVIVINGGITSAAAIQQHVTRVDGVMLGRTAYADPYALVSLQRAATSAVAPARSRDEVVKSYLEHVRRECATGTYLKHMSRHLLNLYQGEPGARAWRRTLSTAGAVRTANPAVIEQALEQIRQIRAATPVPAVAG